MIENLKILKMASAMARYAAERHQVLSQNIANADTSGYRAKDLEPFADAFARADAVKSASRSGSMNIPPKPEYYQVWYAHLENANDDLSTEIQSKLDNGGELDEFFLKDIHERYFELAHPPKQIEKFAHQVLQETNSLQQLSRLFDSNTKQFNSDLADASESAADISDQNGASTNLLNSLVDIAQSAMHADPNLYDYWPYHDRPKIVWPGGKKLAFWIAPNIEFYEFDPPVNPSRPGWPKPTPDVVGYSQRDWGNRIGHWRLMELLDKYEMRGSISLNVAMCDHCPEIIDACNARNWEFFSHGIYNTRFSYGFDEAQERAVLEDSIKTVESATGKRIRGYLAPALTHTERTFDLIAEYDFWYTCDLFQDDQPQPVKTRSGKLISMRLHRSGAKCECISKRIERLLFRKFAKSSNAQRSAEYSGVSRAKKTNARLRSNAEPCSNINGYGYGCDKLFPGNISALIRNSKERRQNRRQWMDNSRFMKKPCPSSPPTRENSASHS